MAWIREEEPAERRPADAVRVVVGGIGVAAAGVSAQAQSSLDTNLLRTVNHLPNGLDGAASALYALGSIWAVIVLGAALLVGRRWPIALRITLAGVAAWGIAQLLNDLLGTHALNGLDITVRTGGGPAFPSSSTAVFTALVITITPYLVRPLRRACIVLVGLVAFAAMYLGTAFPSDVLGGLLLGVLVAGAVLFALGAPGGRPSPDDVREALDEFGFEVADIVDAPDQTPRSTVMHVGLTSGDQLQVSAFGRDQRDGQLATKLWHWVMYREPGLPVFGSRLQQVEHVAYTLLLADRAGVDGPRVVKTGIAGPDAAMLVTSAPEGRPLDTVAPDDVTDALLAAVWKQVRLLHEAGISHGNLDPHRIRVRDDGTVTLSDFKAADASAPSYWRDRDSAAVLVETALLVGNDRAVHAAVGALGRDRAAALIPAVQPATLPAGTTHRTKHLGKTLKTLRSDLAAATGAEDVAPLQVHRLSLANIGMLVGVLIALAIAIPGFTNIDFASVKSQFSNATWGWVVAAALLYPFILVSWATALMGCVNTDLPFIPTVLTQLAATFLNLVTPNGIGGTALQLDYLHHEDVPIASAASAMVLSAGAGAAIPFIMLIAAASLTSTKLDFGNSGGASLGVIALVAAAVGVALLVPKVRGKVIPAIRRAATDVWAVVRNPRKGLQLVGGTVTGNLIYPAVLGLCLMAFGQSLGFAELVVVQLGAGMLGQVAPVPGGIGVQEAALTAGLTGFGIASAPALATVLVFRTVTFVFPPIFGFFTLRWLRIRGYA